MRRATAARVSRSRAVGHHKRRADRLGRRSVLGLGACDFYDRWCAEPIRDVRELKRQVARAGPVRRCLVDATNEEISEPGIRRAESWIVLHMRDAQLGDRTA